MNVSQNVIYLVTKEIVAKEHDIDCSPQAYSLSTFRQMKTTITYILWIAKIKLK